jgi:hypothetical protein
MTQFLKGMSGHQRANPITDEWLTPPEIIGALGPFDVDPCATFDQAHAQRPWRTATTMYSGTGRKCGEPGCPRCVSGLQTSWIGRVWLNCPYGAETGRWIQRLSAHGNGVALVFARTETGWFQDGVLRTAGALFFMMGRLRFHRPDGTPGDYTGGAPSVLVAYGKENVERLRGFQMRGRFIRL